jgi:catechol 2,3-dioxygenase-like lactoylglutathione lyase family enzyme
MADDDMVNVRYMVDDVDAAIAFYTDKLGFELLTSASPAFADVRRGSSGSCWPGRRVRPDVRCPTVSNRDRAAGTGFTSSSMTSTPR